MFFVSKSLNNLLPSVSIAWFSFLSDQQNPKTTKKYAKICYLKIKPPIYIYIYTNTAINRNLASVHNY